MTLRLRVATEADLDRLLAILNGAVIWLQQRGLDQWGGCPWQADELRPSLEAGTLYLAEAGGGPPIATMTLDARPDFDFWTAEDDPQSGLYLSHVAVDRSCRGRGIGSWLLDEATRKAAHDGKKWLRLDAWKTNTQLHVYYRRHGFQQLRTVHVPGRNSGTLFQRYTTATPVVVAPKLRLTESS
ncbi:GNAT family N-acetyltransferase [Micromonospora phytophila]|uniref:GNAT family N-acetyltransferase n=1 Tax=Micromonospora phytophila TaxID=709888 RepID=UPI00202FAFCE|nr:GNAT family N-acetyltransferase [Micromonospora phytophila]MCM0673602.1 GNAT family N-acetyltransferase [Micromonospora phytophila]